MPDKFGGNMDTPEMRAGTTVYLGVNVEGALFSVGDGHYRQGEGESCGTAVEGAMDVTLLVELVKGGGPEWPRLEHDDDLAVVGSGRPLEDAWRASQVGMVARFAVGSISPLRSYWAVMAYCSNRLRGRIESPQAYSATKTLPMAHQ